MKTQKVELFSKGLGLVRLCTIFVSYAFHECTVSDCDSYALPRSSGRNYNGKNFLLYHFN